MVALTLVVIVGSLAVHFSDLSGLPLLVIAATLLNRCSVHHGVIILPIDESRAPAPMALESYLARRFDPRLARCPTSGCAEPIPVVSVAAEGSGVRAAAWTALVLAASKADLHNRRRRNASTTASSASAAYRALGL